METNTRQPKPHIGRNFSRIREVLGIKQEAVALKMGITQQTVSNMEQKEVIDDKTLKNMADALGVKPEAIENFREDAVFNQIHNTLHDHSSLVNFQCTFNPLEKYIEAVDKIEKLYEALLKSEQEKVALLKEQSGKK